MFAYAQTVGTELAHSFVAQINQIILFPLITLMTAVALLVFLWGGFQYVLNAANDGKRAEGQKHMLWGVIGLLVMLSAYAILNIAANTIPSVDLDRYSRPADSFGTDASTVNSPAAVLPDTSNTVGGTPTTPSGSAADWIRADMTAVGIDTATQSGYITAMTVGSVTNRRNAIEDAYSFEFITASTRDALLAEL